MLQRPSTDGHLLQEAMSSAFGSNIRYEVGSMRCCCSRVCAACLGLKKRTHLRGRLTCTLAYGCHLCLNAPFRRAVAPEGGVRVCVGARRQRQRATHVHAYMATPLA